MEKKAFKASGRLRQARPKLYQTNDIKPMLAAETGLVADPVTICKDSLSNQLVFFESNLTSFEKINLVDKGILKQDLTLFKERIGWDYNQLSDILGVARAKLIAKKGEERFDKQVSERILSLADLYSYGYEVFEDEERFNAWIFSPNHSLDGLAPFDYLDTLFGREEIKDLIGRIDYGVYS
jgi:putative toxin-antitoxin system antitoxin component (TIGR02293 family)